MKKVVVLLLLVCSAFSNCEHLIIGDPKGKTLIFQTVAEYYPIPFIRREKNLFFESPNQRVITCIIAYDRLHSKAKAMITSGGIKMTYVNLLLEGERGLGLQYDIAIYS